MDHRLSAALFLSTFSQYHALYHSALSLLSFSHNGYSSIILIHPIHPHLRVFHLPFPPCNGFPSDLRLGGFFSSFRAQCKFCFLRALFPDHFFRNSSSHLKSLSHFSCFQVFCFVFKEFLKIYLFIFGCTGFWLLCSGFL